MNFRVFPSRSVGWKLSSAVFVAVLCLAGMASAYDVSFFVASDTHYYIETEPTEALNAAAIASMNNLPGTAYPVSGWGTVATPRGVLVAGDLTNYNHKLEWTGYNWYGLHERVGFTDDYPVLGGTGRQVKYPVYEGYGNHDILGTGWQDVDIKAEITNRNAVRATSGNQDNFSYTGPNYSWDWDGVHFVNCNYAPVNTADKSYALDFLIADLAANSDKPIVIYHHLGFDGYSTGPEGWWTAVQRETYYNAIKGYDVRAIFTGHAHGSEQIMLRDIPTFVVPSAPGGATFGGPGGFYAVKISDNKLIVANRLSSNEWGAAYSVMHLPASDIPFIKFRMQETFCPDGTPAADNGSLRAGAAGGVYVGSLANVAGLPGTGPAKEFGAPGSRLALSANADVPTALSNFSIELLMKPTSYQDGIHALFATDDWTAGDVALNLNGGNLSLAVNGGPGWTPVAVSEAAPAGQWSHVVVTYSDGLTKYYVNGVLLNPGGTQEAVGFTADFSQSANLGAWLYGGGPDRLFSGALDEFAVYSGVLTDAQILANYNTLMVPEPGAAVLLGIGLIAACFYALRRQRRKISMKLLSLPVFLAIIALGVFSAARDALAAPPVDADGRPAIVKKGVIDLDKVEMTPIVFNGKLYRFDGSARANYFHFVDCETGKELPRFAQGWKFGSALVEGDAMIVTGTNPFTERGKVRVWSSKDLKHWDTWLAFDLPKYNIWNTAVCKAGDKFVMAFEIDQPAEETGVGFTTRFATSKDLRNWTVTPPECVYAKDRYTACPILRYLDGCYYMFYLENKEADGFQTYVVRSRDLVHWDLSPLNPVLRASADDRIVASRHFTKEQRDRIATDVNINNSDMDFCEYQGKVIISYCWGNQNGGEHLAEAVYEGSAADFLRGWFPDGKE